MAKLTNTFSWSFSAAADFDECRRKRYWSKYGMWNGWDPSAPEIQRKAYQLNKMDNRYSLQGQAVEQAVMWVLREKQAGRDVTVDEAYDRVAKPFLNRCWKESKSRQWESSPKRYCCLREHYYGELDVAAGKELASAVTEHAKRCIGHFQERVLPRLEHVRAEHEVHVATVDQGGDPESFAFEGTKIYAIPDYVYRVGDQWHIHDWKSGRPKKEHQVQLALYGLWAHVKHRVSPENIVVYIEYLHDGVLAFEQLVAHHLESVKELARSSVSDMADYLVDGDIKANKPLPREDWDLALSRSSCRWCNFYELCKAELEK